MIATTKPVDPRALGIALAQCYVDMGALRAALVALANEPGASMELLDACAQIEEAFRKCQTGMGGRALELFHLASRRGKDENV